MPLRRKEQVPWLWRAGYGWTWQPDVELDEAHNFESWQDAAHWLRTKITECTPRIYSDPRMIPNQDYQWISAIDQDFSIWKVEL